MVSDGYKEISFGQNVNSYGNDLANGISFLSYYAGNEIDGEFVIRFMSSHPKDASFELIDTIISVKRLQSICICLFRAEVMRF